MATVGCQKTPPLRRAREVELGRRGVPAVGVLLDIMERREFNGQRPASDREEPSGACAHGWRDGAL